MYMYIYMYICIYIYIYIYKWSQVIHDTQSAQYICNHENNVPSRLSPQWLCGNSCTLWQLMCPSV